MKNEVLLVASPAHTKLTVIGKRYGKTVFPKTFSNMKQANAAAAKIPGAWVTASWPHLVAVPVN